MFLLQVLLLIKSHSFSMIKLIVPLISFIDMFVTFGTCKYVYDNSFVDVRNKLLFVDKTKFIYEFLHQKYLILNAPSRFGKTTNLDMISMFLSNHRSKQFIKNLFIQTMIWEDGNFVKEHMGEYPVIHFNLKIRGYSTDYEHTLEKFKVSSYNAFIDHMYLLKSDKLSKEQMSILSEYTDLLRTRLMQTDGVAKGLGFLVEVLSLHHGKPVILLADEFGRGITEGVLNNHRDLSAIVDLYSLIIENVFQNPKLISHALLTGESWLYRIKGTALNLLERVGFMQRIDISRFYGFTYDEVDMLMIRANVTKEKKSEILQWYGGYSSHDGLFQVCCPYSILQYLQHKNKIVYWTGSAHAPDLIRRMVEIESMKKLIISLVMRISVKMNPEKDTKIEEIEFLKSKVEELPQHCENYFLQVLVEAGYLTCNINQESSNTISLVIPNEEVRSAILEYTV